MGRLIAVTSEQAICPAYGKTRKVLRVDETPNVQKIVFECGHNHIIASHTDDIAISESVEELIIKDPTSEMQNAINERDYFKAITYACAIFEYYGKQLLFWYFASNGTSVSREKIDGIELTSIIVMLYTHKIIDDSTKTKICNVKRMRNSFIHEGGSIKLTSLRRKEFDTATKHALTCVKFIKTKHDEEWKKQQANNES